jgi:uncharacterized repeat protein (TIGR01451 family)
MIGSFGSTFGSNRRIFVPFRISVSFQAGRFSAFVAAISLFATTATVSAAMDFGDAPDPTYSTLLANDGARHTLGSGLFLGSVVDGETDGQPSILADGDDMDAEGDDDDGVTLMPLTTCFEAEFTVTASAGGVLNAWIDFNVDGDWDDPGEQIAVDSSVVAGQNSVTFTVPCDASTIPSFARFRINSIGGLGPIGLADDGEVEDHVVEIFGADFGDAPDPTYPTLLSSNGASHRISSVFMGGSVDADGDGQASPNADGDDLDGADDEDGVTFQTLFVAGDTATVTVVANLSSLLNAWIDFNGDGDWNDPDDQIFTDVEIVTGNDVLQFTVPPTATPLEKTYARFRVSKTTVQPVGFGGDGEVEDYTVSVLKAMDASKTGVLVIDSNSNGAVDPGDEVEYTVEISKTGQDASNVTFIDEPDLNTTLKTGSVNTTQGTVTVGLNAGDTSVAVDLGTIQGDGAAVTISFTVVVNDPFPAQTPSIANQGFVLRSGHPDLPTDDPNTPEPGDPTSRSLSDGDGDGVIDALDLCPTDPLKSDPGFCGCFESELDSDSDGSPDCVDECSEDPNKTETGTCGCGIPDMDSDSDGWFACVECDDTDSAVKPDAAEICNDNIDNDCDSATDCEDADCGSNAECATPSPTPTPTATPSPSPTPTATSTPDPNATPDASATPDPNSTPDPNATPIPSPSPNSTSDPDATSPPDASNGDELDELIMDLSCGSGAGCAPCGGVSPLMLASLGLLSRYGVRRRRFRRR